MFPFYRKCQSVDQSAKRKKVHELEVNCQQVSRSAYGKAHLLERYFVIKNKYR